MSELILKVKKFCESSKKASKQIAILDAKKKDQVLLEVAKLIKKNSKKIIEENKKDVELARKNKLSDAKIDRLILNKERIDSLAKSLEEITELPDPVGKILYQTKRKSGINIQRISVPIGVILAIYESRPNVTSDIAALSIKSGNSVILRCGSDSINSSRIIAEIYRLVLKKLKLDENIVILIADEKREYLNYLLKMDKYIDVVVPRGSKSLIEAVIDNTKIPVFRHLDGNCHVYLHQECDFEKAVKIVVNAKMRRTGICGAAESLLVDEKIAKKIIPLIVDSLNKLGCEIRGDKNSIAINKKIKPAKEEDFYFEYLDKIISLKIVKNIDEAICHIEKYGSSHTESIVTENKKAAEKFLQEVNSAIVMHNTSTQFADGGEFGLGAEVGISTGKLHARGPVGLEQLVTYKYVVKSNCALRK
jgi:glutamate-5-semialdehyde dehydrogenase